MALKATTSPRSIAGYDLIECVGAGGYGEVWKVDAPGGLSKAMKLVYGRMDEARATREHKALSRIKEVRHPFLLSLERIEIIDGQLVIVTELADLSLKDRFEECNSQGLQGIPRDELLSYLGEAADALDYMRCKHGLQHLDIKPENLLILSGHIKVADFGLVKELHDVSMSMVGGLTPVYAPPELFDEQASEHSDQYSLAIVYQEMLTGALPFPGRSPAQLAIQHMKSAPRLGPLPDNDRAVLSRALAKDPAKRFPDCRSMIAALKGSTVRTNLDAGESDPEDPSAESDTTSLASQLTQPVDAPPTSFPRSAPQVGPGEHSVTEARGAPESNPRSTLNRDAIPAADSRAAIASAPSDASPGSAVPPHFEPTPRRSGPRPSVKPPKLTPGVDLPSLDLEGAKSQLRPTVFLGIGGTAARTLSALRRRLIDRYANNEPIPAWQMLVLDTDRRDIESVLRLGEGELLQRDEALGVPLRNPHSYRKNSDRLLRWLSRRWLYNIPRSLQCEGTRPLGRLALVDHAIEIREALSRSITTAMDESSLRTSSRVTGLTAGDEKPRIVVVASISGGTGSGIVPDVPFLIRKVLADLKIEDAELTAVLAHSTGTGDRVADLSIANSLACLNELYHYAADESGYPGDPACGLSAVRTTQGGFDNLYLTDLGEDLNNGAYESAVESLAHYLYLDTTTSATEFFGRCRATKAAESSSDQEPWLRTFGIHRLGADLDREAHAAINDLCREVVRGWHDGPPEIVAGASKSLWSTGFQSNVSTEEAEGRDLNKLCEPFAVSLELGIEPLHVRLEEIAAQQLEGPITRQVEYWIDELEARTTGQDDPETYQKSVQEFFQALDSIFGPRRIGEAASAEELGTLEVALHEFSREVVVEKRDAIRGWILHLIDEPGSRLQAAFNATKYFRDRIQQLEQQASDALKEARRETTCLEQHLSGEDPSAKTRRNWLGRGQRNNGTGPSREIWSAYATARWRELSLKQILLLARNLYGELSSLTAELTHVRHGVARLLQQFSHPETTDPAPQSTDRFVSRLRESLHLAISDLAEEVDENFTKNYVEPQGGLESIAEKSPENVTAVCGALRLVAWTAVRHVLLHIDSASLFLDSQETTEDALEQLRSGTLAALPRLDGCGGGRRLLVVLPESNQVDRLADLARQSHEPGPTIMLDSDRDIVFCYENERIPLLSVAERIVRDHPHCVEIARRIHTRIDVEWPVFELPG